MDEAERKEIAELTEYIERKQLKPCDDCDKWLLAFKENQSKDTVNRCFACVFYLRFVLENFNVYCGSGEKENLL